MGIENFMILGRMWIGIVICVNCLYITNFVLVVEFPEMHFVNALYFVSDDSGKDIVGIRQDFGDLVWTDPMKRMKFGCVGLGVVVGVEQEYEVTDFEWFGWGFAVVVAFVFEKSLEDVLNCTFVHFVDSVNQCRVVRLCEGRMDRIGEFQIKGVVVYTAMEDSSEGTLDRLIVHCTMGHDGKVDILLTLSWFTVDIDLKSLLQFLVCSLNHANGLGVLYCGVLDVDN